MKTSLLASFCDFPHFLCSSILAEKSISRCFPIWLKSGFFYQLERKSIEGKKKENQRSGKKHEKCFLPSSVVPTLYLSNPLISMLKKCQHGDDKIFYHKNHRRRWRKEFLGRNFSCQFITSFCSVSIGTWWKALSLEFKGGWINCLHLNEFSSRQMCTLQRFCQTFSWKAVEVLARKCCARISIGRRSP